MTGEHGEGGHRLYTGGWAKGKNTGGYPQKSYTYGGWVNTVG